MNPTLADRLISFLDQLMIGTIGYRQIQGVSIVEEVRLMEDENRELRAQVARLVLQLEGDGEGFGAK